MFGYPSFWATETHIYKTDTILFSVTILSRVCKRYFSIEVFHLMSSVILYLLSSFGSFWLKLAKK